MAHCQFNIDRARGHPESLLDRRAGDARSGRYSFGDPHGRICRHQDHTTIANEGLRAFKKTSILGYELPWNNLTFTTQSFISLSEENLAAKLKALDCYNSQKGRDYTSDEYIRSLAITRGIQIGIKYAETFEVIRWIIN